jgi:hypothetical protein
MQWALHGLIIEGTTNDATLATRWSESFSALPKAENDPDIKCHFEVTDRISSPSNGDPIYTQPGLLSYYPSDSGVVVHYPGFAQLTINLNTGRTAGSVLNSVVGSYGVLEDIVATGLSPHLRRRGLFMIHGFAAALEGCGALFVGHFGAGKTTAGLALLNDGWSLLSNDSPIIGSNGRLLCYPGLLAASPKTLEMFPRTRQLLSLADPDDRERKIEFAADQLWPGAWADSAFAGIILFPQIDDVEENTLQPLDGAEALSRLLPHAMESWDKPNLGPHLTTLRELIEAAPAYIVSLGRDLTTLPELIYNAATR